MANKKEKYIVDKQNQLAVEDNEAKSVSLKNTSVILYAVFLFLFSFLLYANTLDHGFALDDTGVIVDNKLVQQGTKSIPELMKTSLFYGLDGNNIGTWRPLTLITFAIELDFFCKDAAHFHWINVLLYSISIILLFGFLYTLTNKKIIPSLVISLLYAAHPVHTEVVANIKSRDEILSLLFLIGPAWGSLIYIRRNQIIYLAFAAILLILACLSKESAITFILVIPVLLYFFESKQNKRIIVLAVTLIVSSFIYIGLRSSVIGSMSHIEDKISAGNNILVEADFAKRYATVFGVLGQYIKLLFIPHPLVYDYSYKSIMPSGWNNLTNLISFFIVIGLFIYSLFGFKSRNKMAVGILLFLLSISVVSNFFFLIGTVLSERLLFLPSLGFCMAIVYLLLRVTKVDENASMLQLKSKPLFLFSVLILTVLYSFKTITRNPAWKDNYTLFKNDQKLTDKSCTAHYYLGSTLWHMSLEEKDVSKKKELLQQAQVELKRALEIFPKYPDAVINLANVYHEQGDYDQEMNLLGQIQADRKGQGLLCFNSGNAYTEQHKYPEAIEQYKKAIASGNFPPETYVALAIVYNAVGSYDDAIQNCLIALKNKSTSEALMTMGTSFTGKKEYIKSIDYFTQASKADPKISGPWINMGNSYVAMKQFAKAEDAFTKGLKISPDMPEAHYNLGYCYMQENKLDQAAQSFQKALSLRPDYIECYLNLGFVYSTKGNYREAIKSYEKIIGLDPNNVNGYNGLSYCYDKLGNKKAAKEWKEKGLRLK